MSLLQLVQRTLPSDQGAGGTSPGNGGAITAVDELDAPVVNPVDATFKREVGISSGDGVCDAVTELLCVRCRPRCAGATLLRRENTTVLAFQNLAL